MNQATKSSSPARDMKPEAIPIFHRKFFQWPRTPHHPFKHAHARRPPSFGLYFPFSSFSPHDHRLNGLLSKQTPPNAPLAHHSHFTPLLQCHLPPTPTNHSYPQPFEAAIPTVSSWIRATQTTHELLSVCCSRRGSGPHPGGPQWSTVLAWGPGGWGYSQRHWDGRSVASHFPSGPQHPLWKHSVIAQRPPLLAAAVWAAGESKHRSEILLGANPNSSRSVNTTQAKCSLPPSNRETLGLFVVTDKHIITATLASEWGFVVYKVCPLIRSLQPSSQPWRSWRVIITSMAKTQGKYYSKSFILSLKRFSNEGTERTKQPDQALGAGRGRTRHGALASGPTSGSCSLGSCPLFPSLTEKTKLRDVKGFSWDPHPQQGQVSTQLLFNDKTMMKQTKSETQRTSALGGYVHTMTPSAQGVAAGAHKRPPGWTPQGRSWLKEGRATKGRLPRPCDHLEGGHQLP